MDQQLTNYPNLKKRSKEKKNWEPWSVDNLREGLQYYYDLYQKYPTAPEIDKFDFLPSARQIQRRFGGLQNLRTLLGHTDIHYGRGVHRQLISNLVGKRGRAAEIDLEQKLVTKFGEVYVHTEKLFDIDANRKLRVDFYVYSPSGNFGVDIFETDSFQNLQKNINIKIDKYKNFPSNLFLVVSKPYFEQTILDQYALVNKKKALPVKARILNLQSFEKMITGLKAYPDPLEIYSGFIK